MTKRQGHMSLKLCKKPEPNLHVLPLKSCQTHAQKASQASGFKTNMQKSQQPHNHAGSMKPHAKTDGNSHANKDGSRRLSVKPHNKDCVFLARGSSTIPPELATRTQKDDGSTMRHVSAEASHAVDASITSHILVVASSLRWFSRQSLPGFQWKRVVVSHVQHK
ncbi:hypothetical protein VNO78_22569 [Psophocarpus tetragonolobus]|uniref:Uncharacterized protein n=1 Tax=Psophocarpus tetragonolobus TaxID=3891 RepID=A0AAN9XC90_PSOTE